MAETITKKITAVSQKGDGFKVEGYDNWFNLSNDYGGDGIPPVGSEIEFTYKPWLNPKSHKTAYYVDEIIPVTQVAAPAASYNRYRQNAGTPVPPATVPQSTTAPTPAPVAQAPRIEPERVTPDPGSFAYRDIVGIPRTACLKDAGELLASVYAGGAAEVLSDEQIDNLASNITRLANRLYVRYYVQYAVDKAEVDQMNEAFAETATPDDLVPTPSEMDGDPGPVEPHG